MPVQALKSVIHAQRAAQPFTASLSDHGNDRTTLRTERHQIFHAFSICCFAATFDRDCGFELFRHFYQMTSIDPVQLDGLWYDKTLSGHIAFCYGSILSHG